MTKIILRGPVQRDFVIEQLNKLDMSKVWDIEIKRHQNRRSINQNSLYWSWLNIIGDDTGHDADELHDFFKARFLPVIEDEVAGEVFIRRPSTKKLSTISMSEYMTKVEAFAASQLGIPLPHPEDR